MSKAYNLHYPKISQFGLARDEHCRWLVLAYIVLMENNPDKLTFVFQNAIPEILLY